MGLHPIVLEQYDSNLMWGSGFFLRNKSWLDESEESISSSLKF